MENGFSFSCASDLGRYNLETGYIGVAVNSELKLENDEVKSTVIV